MPSHDSTTTQRIREAAYYLWLGHRSVPENALADWLVAEAVVDYEVEHNSVDKVGRRIVFNPYYAKGTSWSAPGD